MKHTAFIFLFPLLFSVSITHAGLSSELNELREKNIQPVVNIAMRASNEGIEIALRDTESTRRNAKEAHRELEQEINKIELETEERRVLREKPSKDIPESQEIKLENNGRDIEGLRGRSADNEEEAVVTGARTYHALLIGVKDYDYIKKLKNPLDDIKKMKNILNRYYTFEAENITLLRNPNRAEIFEALENLKKNLTQDDSLLIFYAGHGKWDEDKEQGYWLPKDSRNDSAANWISNSTIRDYIRGIHSQHTLLISDACFSGGIFQERSFGEMGQGFLKLNEKKSRRAITSGAKNEPVPDNSVFLKYLLEKLKNNKNKLLDSQSLFASIRIPISRNSETLPEDGFIKNTSDEGGDFIFIRR